MILKSILVVSTLSLADSSKESIRRRLALCPNPDTFPTATQPKTGCNAAFVDDDFETSLNGWYGNLGASEELSSDGHTSQYMRVHNRAADWQGPILEMGDDVKGCVSGGSTYLFQVDIRLTKSSGVSNCKALGTNCPVLVSDLSRLKFITNM